MSEAVETSSQGVSYEFHLHVSARHLVLHSFNKILPRRWFEQLITWTAGKSASHYTAAVSENTKYNRQI